jgi:DNA-binding HxlR family transcriptional regulator
MAERRSGCPLSLSLDLLGDRWSLLVVRDVMFAGKRGFREFLRSEEGIAPNILSDRLRRLVAAGMLTRHDDPDHRQKGVFRLTEAAIDLVPVLVQLGAWGTRHFPADPVLTVPSRVLGAGGPATVTRFQDELRAEHLGAPPPAGPSVHASLERAVTEAAATAERTASRS